MKYTVNYNFKKPEPLDTRNINDINESFDLVDGKLKEVEESNKNLDATFQSLVINAGSSNAEIVSARRDNVTGVTYDTLPKRLDKVTSQLSEIETVKANRDEITNVLTPKGNSLYASLPTTGNTVGWYYYCSDGDGTHGAGNYVWNGTSWYFGGTGDEGYSLLKKDLTGLNNEIFNIGKYDNRNLSSTNATSSSNIRRWFTPMIEEVYDSITFYFAGDVTDQTSGIIEQWSVNGGILTLEKSYNYVIPKTDEALKETSVTIYVNAKKSMFSLRLNNNSGKSVVELKALQGGSYLYINNITDTTLNLSNILTATDYYLPYSYNYKISRKSNNIIVVAVDGTGDYYSIQEAIENCNDSSTNHVTILVKPGKYSKFSMAQTGNDVNDITKAIILGEAKMRYISIIGFDVLNTIVYDGSGEYYTPPAEILTRGIIKNISFISDHNNPPSTTVRPWSYAVHIDFAPIGHPTPTQSSVLPTYVPQDVRFENCIFKSAQCSAVGMGLHQDETVAFKDCEFYSTTPTSGTYSQLLNYGSFLCHNYIHANNISGQHLVIDNCVFHSANSPYSLYLTFSDNRLDKTAPFLYDLKVDARRNIAVSDNGSPISIAVQHSNIKGSTTYGNNFNF